MDNLGGIDGFDLNDFIDQDWQKNQGKSFNSINSKKSSSGK